MDQNVKPFEKPYVVKMATGDAAADKLLEEMHERGYKPILMNVINQFRSGLDAEYYFTFQWKGLE